MKEKLGFYLSVVALIFGCFALLGLIIDEGVAGWLFTTGAIGYLISVMLAVIVEQIIK